MAKFFKIPYTKKFFIFFLIFSWVFSSWPKIIDFPPTVKEASAASGDVILLWDTANGSVPSGWTCISCTGGDAFYGVFPRAASSYGASTAGSDTHTHTLTYSSATQGANGDALGELTGNRASVNTHTHTWGNITSGSGDVRPSYKNLNFIYANNPSSIPANVIAVFDSTLPSGWTRYSALDSIYLRGNADNATGGGATHYHAIASDSITSSGHSNILTDSGNARSACNQTAGHLLPSATTNLDNNNNAPPYVQVIFAYNSSGSAISLSSTSATGMIAFFNATPPSGWDTISDVSPWNGNFLMGYSSYGSTGGSSADHNHGGSKSFTSAACASSANGLGPTGTYTGALETHSHSVTYTIDSQASLPLYRDVILAKKEAPTFSISISTNGAVAFGTLALEQTQDNTVTGVNDIEIVNVDVGPVDLDIKSTVFTEGGNTWTLGSSNGSNQVKWEFATSTNNWVTMAVANSNYEMDLNVAQSATRNVYLRITMPTVTNSYNQYSSTVTITASSP